MKSYSSWLSSCVVSPVAAALWASIVSTTITKHAKHVFIMYTGWAENEPNLIFITLLALITLNIQLVRLCLKTHDYYYWPAYTECRGQTSNGRWRLSSSSVTLPAGRAGAPAARRAGGRHCTAGQSCYVPLQRHLVWKHVELDHELRYIICILRGRSFVITIIMIIITIIKVSPLMKIFIHHIIMVDKHTIIITTKQC